MVKTTVYLPQELKERLENAARVRGVPEAELIRAAIEATVQPPRPRPRFGFIEIADGLPIDWNTDDHLAGFGER